MMERYAVTTLDRVQAERAATGDAWHEFWRIPAMSLGIYALRAGEQDTQTPHHEDEVYLVVRGRARLDVDGETVDVAPGMLIFVGKEVPHTFHSIAEDLELLVFFAPAHT